MDLEPFVPVRQRRSSPLLVVKSVITLHCVDWVVWSPLLSRKVSLSIDVCLCANNMDLGALRAETRALCAIIMDIGAFVPDPEPFAPFIINIRHSSVDPQQGFCAICVVPSLYVFLFELK